MGFFLLKWIFRYLYFPINFIDVLRMCFFYLLIYFRNTQLLINFIDVLMVCYFYLLSYFKIQYFLMNSICFSSNLLNYMIIFVIIIFFIVIIKFIFVIIFIFIITIVLSLNPNVLNVFLNKLINAALDKVLAIILSKVYLNLLLITSRSFPLLVILYQFLKYYFKKV